MSFLTQKSFFLIIMCCTDLKLVSCDAAVVLKKIYAPVVQVLNSLMGNLLPLELFPGCSGVLLDTTTDIFNVSKWQIKLRG